LVSSLEREEKPTDDGGGAGPEIEDWENMMTG
jgi:hypothetical protein